MCCYVPMCLGTNSMCNVFPVPMCNVLLLGLDVQCAPLNIKDWSIWYCWY
uniref:Uncharacterized protein n=1 Tax=Picea glauca TaxID=3330 RepID=A0A101M2U6_PICGL|nr:hypothetical protein ABT39_MTgene3254 [Picea glauca]QHR89245.1 hypothetical protein Q903MT_gene3265 [Picea sitchensis]